MGFEFEPSPFGDGDDANVVVVGPTDPLLLNLVLIEHELSREGESCIEVFSNGRRLSRCGVPQEHLDRMQALFSEPRSLVLFAVEDSPGIQARLVALVPRDTIQAVLQEDEPWRASVPSFEENAAGEGLPEGVVAMQPVPLGNIIRFQSDRKFPLDLQEEARDLFLSVLNGGGGDIGDKMLKDLGL